MKNTLLKIFAYGSLLIILLGMVYFFYLVFEPFKVPTITPERIPILNPDKKILQGGTLSTDLNYCIYRKVPTTTTRRIEGVGGTNRSFFFTTAVSNPPIGCKRVIVQAKIPDDIPHGHYQIITTSTYIINSLKTIVATFESEEFEIVDKL